MRIAGPIHWQAAAVAHGAQPMRADRCQPPPSASRTTRARSAAA